MPAHRPRRVRPLRPDEFELLACDACRPSADELGPMPPTTYRHVITITGDSVAADSRGIARAHALITALDVTDTLADTLERLTAFHPSLARVARPGIHTTFAPEQENVMTNDQKTETNDETTTAAPSPLTPSPADRAAAASLDTGMAPSRRKEAAELLAALPDHRPRLSSYLALHSHLTEAEVIDVASILESHGYVTIERRSVFGTNSTGNVTETIHIAHAPAIPLSALVNLHVERGLNATCVRDDAVRDRCRAVARAAVESALGFGDADN